jgi:hypothetical protein
VVRFLYREKNYDFPRPIASIILDIPNRHFQHANQDEAEKNGVRLRTGTSSHGFFGSASHGLQGYR